ncbi:MAG: hypothetical protein N2999_05360 [Proteobacteria bacterium]|nr:hypothetical protein [Pseudomonadota bacterium]
MAEKIIRNKKFIFTDHSLKRFSARRINDELFNLAVIHGRKFYSNGAEIYFVGKKEVEKARKLGIDLRSAEGLNIIVQPYGDEKIVITGFKNPSLKKYRQH